MQKNNIWPGYFGENLICGNPEGEIGIITLWTPTKSIIEKINKDLFYVAGQLYSKEGINFIIRNILARPLIRYLIICGQDLSGSGQALVNFFTKGVDKDYNIIGTPNALIHKEIPTLEIEKIRKNVKIENLIGISDPAIIIEKIKNYKPVGGLFDESKIFPSTLSKSAKSCPTDQSVFKMVHKYIGPAWLEILETIWRFGRKRESFYGNSVREIFNTAVIITEEDSTNPKIFPYFSVTKQDIEHYCQLMMKGERGDEIYSYGERLWNYKGINQVEEVIIPFLTKYPTDRAALAVLFDLTKDHKASRSPCLCLVQATNLDDKLNLTAYFRSHDIFSAWILNAFGLRRLQAYIAKKLKLEIGTLTIFSNCAHIYDNQWQLTEKIIEEYGEKLKCTPDPRGYFIISVEGREIVAKLHSPEGIFLEEFRQDGTVEKVAVAMYQKLVAAHSVSLISHAFDLGTELQKAEIAIKHNLKYIQDQPLQF